MNTSEKPPIAAYDHDLNQVHEAQVEGADALGVKRAIDNIDHDDAAELFSGEEDSFYYTDKEASWVRWKLDLILLSMVQYTSSPRFLRDGLIHDIDDTYLHIFVHR
jgi:ACS family allantoate permease-like MFS transporter